MNTLQQDTGAAASKEAPAVANAILDCGWGRLMYAPSFESTRVLADELMKEEPGKRDIALYVQAPQLVLAEAQASLFLDPSVMFRRTLGADAPAARKSVV